MAIYPKIDPADPKPRLCERCQYDMADPGAEVPEFFADQYQDICEHCASELAKRMARGLLHGD